MTRRDNSYPKSDSLAEKKLLTIGDAFKPQGDVFRPKILKVMKMDNYSNMNYTSHSSASSAASSNGDYSSETENHPHQMHNTLFEEDDDMSNSLLH